MLGTANEIHVWLIIDTNVLAINFEFGEFFAGNNFDISDHIFYSYQKFHYKKWLKLCFASSTLLKGEWEKFENWFLYMSDDALIFWAKYEVNQTGGPVRASLSLAHIDELFALRSSLFLLTPLSLLRRKMWLEKPSKYEERNMFWEFSLNRHIVPLKYCVFWEWPDPIRKKLGWDLTHLEP